jgi:alpha,alpha-trehalase
VDLNAQLYKYEKDFEEAALILGETDEAAEWGRRALARKNMMRKYLWDDSQGFYFDYNYMSGKHSPVWSLAAFTPMWAGMDDPETAARMVKHLDKFEYEGGLSCTAELPKVASPLKCQWAWPNGWAPLHMNVTQALERYDYHLDAERIARKWLKACLTQFERRGEFLEKYNVVRMEQDPADGVYPLHVGFGWSNASFERFCQRYLKSEEMPAFRESEQVSALSQLVKNPRHTLRRMGVKLNMSTVKRLS